MGIRLRWTMKPLVIEKKQMMIAYLGLFFYGFHQKLPGKMKCFVFAISPPDDLLAALAQI